MRANACKITRGFINDACLLTVCVCDAMQVPSRRRLATSVHLRTFVASQISSPVQSLMRNASTRRFVHNMTDFVACMQDRSHLSLANFPHFARCCWRTTSSLVRCSISNHNMAAPNVNAVLCGCACLGRIPSEILQLQLLQALNVTGNPLTGERLRCCCGAFFVAVLTIYVTVHSTLQTQQPS